jgi:hypothetical protein
MPDQTYMFVPDLMEAVSCPERAMTSRFCSMTNGSTSRCLASPPGTS